MAAKSYKTVVSCRAYAICCLLLQYGRSNCTALSQRHSLALFCGTYADKMKTIQDGYSSYIDKMSDD